MKNRLSKVRLQVHARHNSPFGLVSSGIFASLLFSALLLIGVHRNANAQVLGTASLTGIITDPSGAIVP